MDINIVRSKILAHNYITLKQADNYSPIELYLCGADGKPMTSLSETCTVTLYDTKDRVVRSTATGSVSGGVLSFKVEDHLKANPHNLEVTTSSGRKFPADGNFTVYVTQSHEEAELNIINGETKEEAIKRITADIATYIQPTVNTWLAGHITEIEGPKGDPFVYADFTPAQLELLRGPRGPQGDPFKYSDFTQAQLDALKVKGDTGDSAYQVWLKAGNTGTVVDYLNSLKGAKGDKGDGLQIDGIASSVDQLPTGTTKSTYLVGTKLYFRDAGSSTWTAGPDIKGMDGDDGSVVTLVNGMWYIDNVNTNVKATGDPGTNGLNVYLTSITTAPTDTSGGSSNYLIGETVINAAGGVYKKTAANTYTYQFSIKGNPGTNGTNGYGIYTASVTGAITDTNGGSSTYPVNTLIVNTTDSLLYKKTGTNTYTVMGNLRGTAFVVTSVSGAITDTNGGSASYIVGDSVMNVSGDIYKKTGTNAYTFMYNAKGPKGDTGIGVINKTFTGTISDTNGGDAAYATGTTIINASDWNVYQKTGTNTYSLSGNIKGNPGPAGKDGLNFWTKTFTGTISDTNGGDAAYPVGTTILNTTDWHIYVKTDVNIYSDKGSISNTSTTPADTTPPNAPTVSAVNTSSTTITGTAEANSTVTATFKTGSTTNGTATATTGSNGAYTITKPSGLTLTANDTVTVTAKDAAGNVSTATTVTVTSAAPANLWPTTSVDWTGKTIAGAGGSGQQVVMNSVFTYSMNETFNIDLTASGDTVTMTNQPDRNRLGYFTLDPNTQYTIRVKASDTIANGNDLVYMIGDGNFINPNPRVLDITFTTDSAGKWGRNQAGTIFANAGSSWFFQRSNGGKASTTTYKIWLNKGATSTATWSS